MIAALVPLACTTPEDPTDPPVAHAYGQHLRRSDIRVLIPMDATAEDSAARAATIIDGWLHEQALLHRAEKNLSEADKDFEARLRDYRNDLIVYAYERAMVEQKLDTVIDDGEVRAYYEANPGNFELKDHIVRARWFRIRETDARALRKVEAWFRSTDPAQRHELELWLAQRGIVVHEPAPSTTGDTTAQGWMRFSELLQQVPLRTHDPVAFLEGNNRLHTVNDSAGTCFVEILEHRLSSSVSPLPMVAATIRAVLLEQRKQLFLQKLREDLYKQAIANDEIGRNP